MPAARGVGARELTSQARRLSLHADRVHTAAAALLLQPSTQSCTHDHVHDRSGPEIVR